MDLFQGLSHKNVLVDMVSICMSIHTIVGLVLQCMHIGMLEYFICACSFTFKELAGVI